MSNIAIYLSSRNNYDMMESVFLKHVDLGGFQLYNIDDASEPEEVIKGKEICARHNIKFIPNQDRGLQWAAKTMLDNIDDDVEFIVWCTHDTVPMNQNFFKGLSEKVATGKLNDFGMIGFNIMGPQNGIQNPSQVVGGMCGIIGRAPLMKLPGRGGWFRSTDMKMDWDVWGKPCSIDAPVDMLLMMNVKLFREHINVSNKYHLFCAHDDIAMQYLNKNIHNIVLPEFVVWHDQHLKEQANVPVKSARAAKQGDSKHFGDYGPHLEYWKQTWGWDRDDRSTFEAVADKYKGTLIYETYFHNCENGPLKSFDI